MQIETRRLESKDLDRVCELEERSFSMPWKKCDFEDLLARDESVYFVILADGVLVGTAGYTFNGYEGYINNVVIDENYRGKGLSKVLLTRLLEYGKSQGVFEFTLEVRVGNKPANGLYESLGFVNEGIRKNFYERPTEDANVLWLRYKC